MISQKIIQHWLYNIFIKKFILQLKSLIFVPQQKHKQIWQVVENLKK